MAEELDQTAIMQRNALQLITTMDQNPEAKAHLERALKVVKPDYVAEEDVAARYTAPVAEQVTALKTQLDEFLKAQREREEQAQNAAVENQIESAFDRLAKAGYTSEGQERIKALMVERKIADPEAAALLFDKLNPPPPQEHSAYTPATWDIGASANGAEDTKLLFQNEDRWADLKTAEVLNEIRVGRPN